MQKMPNWYSDEGHIFKLFLVVFFFLNIKSSSLYTYNESQLLNSENVSQIPPHIETTCIKRLSQLLKSSTHTLKKVL